MNRTSVTLFLFLLLFLTTVRGLSQPVFDDFSDNDLTNSPTWTGDTSFWKVDQGMLRSQGPAVSGTCIGLNTSGYNSDSIEWQFYGDLKMATSANNYLEFLLLDGSDGLVIKLGGTADEVSLYRRKGTTDSLLIDGADKRLASSSSNKLLVRLRKAGDHWQMETCTDVQNPQWLNEGTCTLSSGAFTSIGFRACYSSANGNNFRVDDVYSGQWRIDREAPILVHAFLYDPNSWQLVFSEAMDTSKGQVGPAGIKPLWLNFQTVRAPLFSSADSQQLLLSGFSDLAGLILSDTLLKEMKRPFQFREVQITELMPDPSPPLGLPEIEWIELFNTGTETIQLFDFRLSDATSSVVFPYRYIKPDSLLVLTATGNCSLLPAPCLELPISGSFLNNASDHLALLNRQGDTMEKLSYSDTWYRDVIAKNGGVSLEKIDPRNPCVGDADNFIASVDTKGGTPGAFNSRDERLVDTSAPFVTDLRVVTGTLLTGELSEETESSPVVFELDGSAQNLTWLSPTRFNIHLGTALQSNPSTWHRWSLQNLKDCSGNTDNASDSFRYAAAREPEPFDLMFSEIMFLPEDGASAFVGVYNRSDEAIDMSGLKLEMAGKTLVLPPFVLYPGEELVLHGTADSLFTSPNTKVTGWKNPGKEGGWLSLRNVYGDLVDAACYSDTFFIDASQQMGGYSLERTDTSFNCSSPSLWEPSVQKGGSPGSISIHKTDQEETDLHIQSIYPLDSRNLVLGFSYALSPGIEPGLDLSPGSNSIEAWYQEGNNYRNWRLVLKDSLWPDQHYLLRLNGVLSCENADTDPLEISIRLPGNEPKLHINEILFDPVDEEPDFVELINTGTEAVDLKGFVLAAMDPSGNLEDPVAINTTGYLLMPGEYVVITGKGQRLADRYGQYKEEKVLECVLPSFPNEEGTVLLLDTAHKVLDSFVYESGMHSPFMTQTEGVSLERIHPAEATNNPSNWTSASATERFGTPGRRNSQYREKGESTEHWQLWSGTFSPDGDGFEDLAMLSYQGLEPGSHATIRVYSLSGNFLFEWVNNWPCGTEGTLNWDGRDSYGQALPFGPFLLWIAWIDPSGKQKVERKILVKAGYLNE